MIKKKKAEGGGANWMDTYGDLVTLLLCFFVLLYSMSTIDQQKWEMLVRSFNPDAIPEITVEEGNDGQVADPVANQTPNTMEQAQVEESIDELYEALQNYIEQQGAQESISATRGDGYVFLSLNDAVFFNGDSYVLREDGKLVLDDVGAMIAQASDAIDELRVLGHTAQASPDQKNEPMPDRMLSTNRANAVLCYLQEEVEGFTLDPARMLSIGYGQWRPISPNDTGELRAKNRRVEFIITGKDVENSLSDSIVEYYTTSETAPPPGSFPEGLFPEGTLSPAETGAPVDTVEGEPATTAPDETTTPEPAEGETPLDITPTPPVIPTQ